MCWFLSHLKIATGYKYMELKSAVIDKDTPSEATVHTDDDVQYLNVYSM